VAEQADAGDLKSSGLNTLVGSIPTGPIHTSFLKLPEIFQGAFLFFHEILISTKLKPRLFQCTTKYDIIKSIFFILLTIYPIDNGGKT
jgi:hypothetical protein